VIGKPWRVVVLEDRKGNLVSEFELVLDYQGVICILPYDVKHGVLGLFRCFLPSEEHK
jgi:hypothetical protein